MDSAPPKPLDKHTFVRENEMFKKRRYCRGCYKKKQLGEIDKNKVRKVYTYCLDCRDHPRFCAECFVIEHNLVVC